MENDTQTKLSGLLLTAIIAEKDATFRLTLAAILSYGGYRVYQAENLNAAISCVDKIKDFDVLFADIEMPGWKSLMQHAVKTTPRAFVIAMVENDLIPEISDLNRYGVEACLQKPLLYDDILRVLSTKVEDYVLRDLV